MNYKRINDLSGWAVFGVALVAYLLTVSPTASFWDCGEFIAVSNELEVPHPPGAPMFLLIGRFFAMFAGSNVENVAYFVNLSSVVASAFTALFTFWITTMLGKRVLAPNEENPSMDKTVGLMFAGAVGGLTCAFATSIWFNAVEAEVYAMSSFFTAIVVWLMLKWDARADEPDHFKWIILIAYMMGVSIGVHLLNLLAIPALGVMYYFRKYKFSWMGFFAASGISVVILGFINSFFIKKMFEIAMYFERFFTGTYDITGNSAGDISGLGLPFGFGSFFFAFLLLAALVYGIYYSNKNKLVILNVSLISVVMLFLGISSYSMILIRANAGTPINENNPGNILTFLQYMSREQYGDWPVLYGPMYNSIPSGEVQDKPMFYTFIEPQTAEKWKGVIDNVDPKGLNTRYVKYDYKPEYEYGPGGERFFPRMHSSQHYSGMSMAYENYVSDKGQNEQSPYDDNPSGLDNMKFFFGYQLNYMYIRYFMWNFVGREGDDQHEIDEWESGLAGNSKIPEWFTPKGGYDARNHYFYLPLILGLLGMAWQISRKEKDAAIVGMLFFFTGLAIILYLNQTPSQPRERDYSYAGSFQTFAIWVGLGVLAIISIINDYLKKLSAASPYVVGPLCLLMAPGLMASQNWRDHSRAGNYFAADSARNYLESCAQNGIIFTNGDNDTFPLWYLQEVEGVRPDVRIINLSLLNTDWYIHQLKSKINKADGIPLSLDETFYMGEKNGLKEFSQKQLIVELPVSNQAKINLVQSGALKAADTSRIPSKFIWKINLRGSQDRRYLQKQDLLIIDILKALAKDDWKRPMYFAISVPSGSYVSLGNYMIQEGMAKRVVPLEIKGVAGQDPINRELMYANLMTKFKFRGLNDPDVFFDSNARRMASNFQSCYAQLAVDYLNDVERMKMINENMNRIPNLSSEQKRDSISKNETLIAEYQKRAKALIDFVQTNISDDLIRTDAYWISQYASIYLRIGEIERGKKLMEKAHTRLLATMEFNAYRVQHHESPLDENISYYAYRQLIDNYIDVLNDPQSARKLAEEFQNFTGQTRLLRDVEEQMQRQALPQLPAAPASQDSTTPKK